MNNTADELLTFNEDASWIESKTLAVIKNLLKNRVLKMARKRYGKNFPLHQRMEDHKVEPTQKQGQDDHTGDSSHKIQLLDMALLSIKLNIIDRRPLQDVVAISLNFVPRYRLFNQVKNRIHKIRELRKAEFPALKELWYWNNSHIDDSECLTMLKSPTLEQISLEYYDEHEEQSRDIRWIVKMRSPKVNKIWIKSSKRVSEHAQESGIKKKYQNVEFYKTVVAKK